SRLTYRGTIMNGKMTMSRRGRTGRTSGTLGVSSLPGVRVAASGSSVMGVPGSSFLFLPLDDDHGGAAATVLQPRHADGEDPAIEAGLRAAHVHRHVEGDKAREAPLRPLHTQEAGPRTRRALLAAFARDDEMAVSEG